MGICRSVSSVYSCSVSLFLYLGLDMYTYRILLEVSQTAPNYPKSLVLVRRMDPRTEWG